MQRTLTVAIMSPGDVGHAVGRVILKRSNSGIRVITNLTGRSDRTCQLAKSTGIIDVGSDDELVQQADIILSIVTTWEAITLAKRISSIELKNPNLLFVDLNDLAPETVLTIAALFPTGRFIDGCIIGGPPRDDGYSPSIYLSGEHTHELDFMKNPCGLDIRTISTKLGHASGLKMCYAPMFKSVTALGIQAFATAKMLGLSDVFLDELKHSLPELSDVMHKWIPDVASRASRWASEMDEITKTYATLGLSTKILDGAADTYRLVADQTELGTNKKLDQTLDGTVQIIADALKNEGHQLTE